MYARSYLGIALLALIAAGCDPGGRWVNPGDVDNLGGDSDDDTWSGFTPMYFGVNKIAFAYDFATLRAVPVVTEDAAGNPVLLPISMTVLLLDAVSAESGQLLDGHYCEVVMTSSAPLPYADWTGDAGAWFAFELADSVGTTNCQELNFNPDVWGTDVHTQVTKWTWGGGINALSADAVETLGDSFAILEPWVQGGGFYWEELPYFIDAQDPDGELLYDDDGYIDVGITYAYEVDADFNLVLVDDEKVLIPAEDVAQPNNNALTAYYEVQVNRFLKPARHLLLDPPE